MNESIDLLRSHFGLTTAEARVALHLVAGGTLRAAAFELSITYETARTHLKNIFGKTGTCRQAELVIAIVTALPQLRLSSPLLEPREGLDRTNKISGVNEQIPGGGSNRLSDIGPEAWKE
jgi:DNA-binding CsgD family transcriptional regulator